jgi:hypothetical protein
VSVPWRGTSPEEAAGLGALLQWAVRLAAVLLAAAVVPWEMSGASAVAGVTVLLSAPYLATLSAALLYVRRRRWREAALAALLLALLVAGLWLGTGRG